MKKTTAIIIEVKEMDKVRKILDENHINYKVDNSAKKIKKDKEIIPCEDCRFKFRKSEMLEKDNGKKGGESKWYCRRCALWNRG